MKNVMLVAFLVLSPWATAEEAVFAGGCFWCMESDFQDLEGVSDVISGFTGGALENPTYQGDHRGHYEAVLVTYDPAIISYQQLLDVYWVNIDPFDARGQFCDKGPSYRAALFVSEEQRSRAEDSRRQVVARFPDQRVVTEILPLARFWPVEEYHQDYYLKNPLRYKYYRYGCRRDARLEAIWGESRSK